MSLRKNKTFAVVGYGLIGLALLSAFAHIAYKALSGSWNETYHSAKLVGWTYGGAFILVCILVLVGAIGLVLFLQRRLRSDRTQRRK